MTEILTVSCRCNCRRALLKYLYMKKSFHEWVVLLLIVSVPYLISAWLPVFFSTVFGDPPRLACRMSTGRRRRVLAYPSLWEPFLSSREEPEGSLGLKMAVPAVPKQRHCGASEGVPLRMALKGHSSRALEAAQLWSFSRLQTQSKVTWGAAPPNEPCRRLIPESK